MSKIAGPTSETEVVVGAGRYAPSPTGDLHVGNLRTALIAWAAARSTERKFYLRLEDLDTDRRRDPSSQIADLQALGIDWDGPIIVQSERVARYQRAMEQLDSKGLVFECFCSRKDIREALSASHSPPGHYPGTCLKLTGAQREAKLDELASRGLKPALRLAPAVPAWTIQDMYKGEFSGPIDNVVLQRGDGAFAYNLAVVVDDVATGIDQVVRGDDLLESSPIHSYLAVELGGKEPVYGHVPLVLGSSGKRLAKRDGAITLAELKRLGFSPGDVLEQIGRSLGVEGLRSSEEFLEVFPSLRLPTEPWRYTVL